MVISFLIYKVPETLLSDVVLFSGCSKIIGAIDCTRFLKQKKFFCTWQYGKVWGVDQIISKYSGFQILDYTMISSRYFSLKSPNVSFKKLQTFKEFLYFYCRLSRCCGLVTLQALLLCKFTQESSILITFKILTLTEALMSKKCFLALKSHWTSYSAN